MTFDRVERLIGRSSLEHLASATVAVVGLGSGGSFVALSLAMSGVGGFVLIDPDTLEAANTVRHASDLRDVGRSKAEATAALILARNPAARVHALTGRVEDHWDALDTVDLVVVAVDGEPVKYQLNEACLEHRRTAVYAGVYARGEGGDVVTIRPFDGPCYACWAAEVRGDIQVTRTADDDLDYGMIGEGGTLEAEPGLWLDVVRVASVQADFVLTELLSTTPAARTLPGNTVLLANTALEIIEGETTAPYSAVWVTITRDPSCLVCGPAHQTQASMSLDALVAQSGIEMQTDTAGDADAAQMASE
jgi:molybdopterin/thiamine biosynthesis adenylyltransferase